MPKLVYETKRTENGEVIDRNSYYSMKMPIDIPGLSSTSGFVLFEGLPHAIPADAKSLVLSVGTNRGRRRKTTLELPAVLRSLNEDK